MTAYTMIFLQQLCRHLSVVTAQHASCAVAVEAVYFGSAKGGLNHGGAGAGPWIMADMENALVRKQCHQVFNSICDRPMLALIFVTISHQYLAQQWGADKVVSNEEPINHPFVTGMQPMGACH